MLRIGLLLLILPLVLLLGGYFFELSSVNECLRQQGSFDYARQVCDLHRQHPFVPYSQRHPGWVNGTLLASLLGLLFCIVGLYRGRR